MSDLAVGQGSPPDPRIRRRAIRRHLSSVVPIPGAADVLVFSLSAGATQPDGGGKLR